MERLHRVSKILFIGLFLMSFLSCDAWQEVCTSEFKIIGIQVLSADEEPIILDEVSVTNLETDRVVEICDDGLGNCEKGVPAGYPEEGLYFIFHDGLRDEIPGDDTKILVEGSNDEIHFQEDFKIGDNGCHVFKEAGQDTVFVEVE